MPVRRVILVVFVLAGLVAVGSTAAVVGRRWLSDLPPGEPAPFRAAAARPEAAPAGQSSVDPPAARLAINEPLAHQGELRDVRGNRRDLAELAGPRGTVLVFLGCECPQTAACLPRLMAIEKHYRPREFQFVGVYPHHPDTLDRIAAHAAEHDLPWPVVYDVSAALARRLGVSHTPAACVLDAGGVLRFRGGTYADLEGTPPDAALAEPLLDALESLLAGRLPQRRATPLAGTRLVHRTPPQAPEGVSYYRDVAPILARRCQGCHRAEQVAPFALESYADAARWSEMIAEVVHQRRMPPWHADGRFGRFRNDRRMSDAEIETVLGWIEAGLPEGDPAQAPPPIDWPSGWSLGEPDVVIALPEPQEIPAEGPQIIRQIFVPVEETEALFAEDRWIQSAEVRPTALGVVHHVLVHVVPPGELPPPDNRNPAPASVGWAPGEPAYAFPPGSALKIPRGSRLCFELHYAPNGKPARDRSLLGLTFAKQPPEHPLQMLSPSRVTLAVPAHDPHYVDVINWTYLRDARLLGLMGHMHLRGKSYRIEAIYPDGRRDTLLWVPRYDFNWQTFYWLDQPLLLPKGTELRVRSVWDNSRHNPANPDPGVTARTGWLSENEMQACWSIFEVLEPAGEAPAAGGDPQSTTTDGGRL